MKRIIAIVSLMLVCNSLHTNAATPKVGDAAPEIAIETLLQASAGDQATFKSLKGKAVVLEFWATWCGPCVAAIPHLNELADKFKDRGVQFISVTDESKAIIEPFIKKRAIHTWLALDTDRSTFKSYEVKGIPHTVLVDQEGKIAGITYPDFLTEAVLDDLLAGKPLQVPDLGRPLANPMDIGSDAEATAKPLLQILIRSTENRNGSSRRSDHELMAESWSVLQALASAYDFEGGRIAPTTPLPEGRYTFVIESRGDGPHDLNRLFQFAIHSSFGLAGRVEQQQKDALVVTMPDRQALKLLEAASTGSFFRSTDGGFEVVGGTVDTLCSQVESILDIPVVDETGLTGRYDWRFSYEVGNPESIIRSIEKDLGLKLTKERRLIDMLIVDKVQE